MNTTKRLIAILSLLFVLFSSATTSYGGTSGLVMGLVSTESKDALLASWQPLIDDMADYLGIPVKGVVLDDYAGIIWYLASGKAQVAWVGNKAAIEAVDRAGAEVIVQSVTPNGPGYHAHLITRADSPLNSDRDVLKRAKDLVFGNGDPNSTSGYVVPGYYVFASRGFDPKRIFKRVNHNNHEGNFHAVAAGRVDVATNNSSALARYKSRFPEEYNTVKVIWTSPLIPSDPVVVRKDLPAGLKAGIADFLTQYAKPEPGKEQRQLEREQAMLSARKWTGFQPSDNSQLVPIRKLELFKQRLAIEKDRTLPDDVREQRLKTIDQKLKSLND